MATGSYHIEADTKLRLPDRLCQPALLPPGTTAPSTSAVYGHVDPGEADRAPDWVEVVRNEPDPMAEIVGGGAPVRPPGTR